ncbi:MAG TPA: protease complex subunit PrcB family protein [bacterium]|nr:protease complex subunit PrcB family protein [bacterium]
MRNCAKVHPLLPLEAEGALTPGERKKVRAHLSACPAARAELESLRRLRDVLRRQPEPPLPWDLHGKIMARLRKEGLGRTSGGWGRTLWPLAAAAATTVFFFTENPRWEEIVRSPNPPAAPQTPSEEVAAKKVTASIMKAPGPAALSNAAAPAPAMAPAAGPPAAGAPPQAFEAKSVQAPRAAMDEASGGANAPEFSAQTAAQPHQAVRSLPAAQAMRNGKTASWSGDQDPLSQTAGQSLITDEAAFEKVWRSLKPGGPVPPVDFTTQAVVFLEAGLEPTPGYRVEVTAVEEQAGQVVVHWRTAPPPADAVLAQQVTYPWLLQAIPKPDNPVLFLQDPGQ